MVWHFSANGLYSVQIGYKAAMEIKYNQTDEASQGEERKFWNSLWRLPVQPKIRNFLWNATRKFCLRTGIYTDEFTPSIQAVLVTVSTEKHSLYHCHSAIEAWNIPYNQDWLTIRAASSQDLFNYIVQNEDEEQCAWIGTFLWFVWYNRNQFVDKGKTIPATSLV